MDLCSQSAPPPLALCAHRRRLLKRSEAMSSVVEYFFINSLYLLICFECFIPYVHIRSCFKSLGASGDIVSLQKYNVA